jgi:ribosomal protein S18 acetylase RimI-like enzyme
MNIKLKQLDDSLWGECIEIFNQIIEEGDSFPWDEQMTDARLRALFAPSDAVWCAVGTDEGRDVLLGFVHIHPNNNGRCAHVANCGYCVRREARGRGVGKLLVGKSIEAAREMGFRGIQFNAVVSTNTVAVALYQRFGFEIIGAIPGGFRLGSIATGDVRYVDMYVMYKAL